MHAAALMKEIVSLNPEFSFSGIGGPEMKKEGAKVIYETKDVNFIGFSSVLKNIKKIKAIMCHCISEVKLLNPEAVILVDYPGFNLRFASGIRKFYKGKIIYYISPQLWAWHKSRVKIIQKCVDLMIVVFAFEVDFYNAENIKAEFVGHPLVKRIDEFLANNKKVDTKKIQISILPGSRKDEIERMLPVLVKAADKFKEEFDCDINIICSSNYKRSYFEKFISNKNCNLIHDENSDSLNYKTILNSDLVITKSGTSTLECALIGTPFCVVYKTGRLNYLIGKNLIKVKNIAMINILLGKTAVKEFLQNKMTPENIFEEGKKILNDKSYSDEIKHSFIELRKIITGKDASANAAKLITNFIG